MSETKFTPGPWKWWTSNSWRRLTAHNKPHGHYKREGDVICPVICRDGHPDLSISEDDMALIAAAPDLYEALIGISEILWSRPDLSNKLHSLMGPAEKATFEIASAALKKARGEA